MISSVKGITAALQSASLPSFLRLAEAKEESGVRTN